MSIRITKTTHKSNLGVQYDASTISGTGEDQMYTT